MIPTASTSLKEIISQNVTSPGVPSNLIDYHIVGTPLVLRITETGYAFSPHAVEEIIDAAIYSVVKKINAGWGKYPIEHDRFRQLSPEIDLRIAALAEANFTYFLLGDVLAGVWQYMNQPWSSFREVVFDVVLNGNEGWDYIGYGHFAKFGPLPPPPYPPPPPPPAPEPSTPSRNTDLVLNRFE